MLAQMSFGFHFIKRKKKSDLSSGSSCFIRFLITSFLYRPILAFLPLISWLRLRFEHKLIAGIVIQPQILAYPLIHAVQRFMIGLVGRRKGDHAGNENIIVAAVLQLFHQSALSYKGRMIFHRKARFQFNALQYLSFQFLVILITEFNHSASSDSPSFQPD